MNVTAVAETMPGAADDRILDQDYGELVFTRGRPAPPAILLLRQEPYPPMRPADLVFALLAEPAAVDGFFVVIGEATVRRRPLPLASH